MNVAKPYYSLKQFRKLIWIIFCLLVLIPGVRAQTKPTLSLVDFKALLANINATFLYPDGVKETKTPNTDKLPFQYGLKIADADCEIWFEVNSVKADWQRFEKENGKQAINPDSLYMRVAANQAANLAEAENYLTRNVPAYVLNHYKADEGRSYFLTLTDQPETNHYQYGLLLVLQKNHYGNITALCMSNEKGPSFFRNLQKLQDCLKFN